MNLSDMIRFLTEENDDYEMQMKNIIEHSSFEELFGESPVRDTAEAITKRIAENTQLLEAAKRFQKRSRFAEAEVARKTRIPVAVRHFADMVAGCTHADAFRGRQQCGTFYFEGPGRSEPKGLIVTDSELIYKMVKYGFLQDYPGGERDDSGRNEAKQPDYAAG